MIGPFPGSLNKSEEERSLSHLIDLGIDVVIVAQSEFVPDALFSIEDDKDDLRSPGSDRVHALSPEPHLYGIFFHLSVFVTVLYWIE